MEDVDIRPVPPDGARAILEVVRGGDPSLLTELVGFSPALADIQRHAFGDPDYDAGLLLGAYSGVELVGFVQGIHRPWKQGRETLGGIKWILVREPWRGRGVGSRLLQTCELALVTRGMERAQFGCCAPRYLLPGVPENDAATRSLLRAQGWEETSERINLVIDAARVDSDRIRAGVPRSSRERYALRRAARGDAAAAGAFIEEAFSRSWAEEVRPGLEEAGEAACWILRERNGDGVVGFAAFGATNPNWFGPMGVHAHLRGQGLGRWLVAEALAGAREGGHTRVLLPWVNENEAFYRHVAGPMARHVFRKCGKSLRPKGAIDPRTQSR